MKNLNNDTMSLDSRIKYENDKRIESGRSMVEMLGVLAVIGVLSIGGIMGYSYGMDKYRANQTMQDVNLRGIDALAQFDRTGNANLNEWQNEKTIYPITLEDEIIGIQVDKVPERVCNMLAEGMAHVATGIKVNGAYVTGDNNTCDSDENTLVFYFDEKVGNNNDTGAIFPEEEDKKTCGDIVCGECELCDKGSQTCVPAEEMAVYMSDFACTTTNGDKGYCGNIFGRTGCVEYYSECKLSMGGSSFMPLDSRVNLQTGKGGFTCTKADQSGYCMGGTCIIPGDPSVCETDDYDAECMTNLNGTCVPSEGAIQCSANGYNGYCSLGKCLPACNNCGNYQFCGDLNTSCTKSHPMVCKDLDFSEHTIAGTTYYISNNPMSWWDNEAACTALSKKTGKTLSMISIHELVMGSGGSKWPGDTGYYTATEVLKELYNSIDDKYLWTEDLSNSCGAFFVGTNRSVNRVNRSQGINPAILGICR